ncbi:BRCT domain-containing protein [Histoplasma capsulatum var. duboisii H88]|uniref:BRCT domain-containing protein n=1 Tax=Ajellomyces capsulatus (strain H88) TaxID=544711 RepID=A0A8A1LLF0_AJEC8|nr:BRCT domain-containing protein [Histoplasma capsulatum var. duboisii H88]
MDTQDDSLDLDYLKQAAFDLTDERPKQDVSRNLQLRDIGRFLGTQAHAIASLNTTTKLPLQPDAGHSSVPESPFPKMAAATGSLPGDTQPISQSVFGSFMSKARANQGRPKDQEGNEDGNVMAKDATLHEGDTGHLDLLAAFGETPVANREFADEDGQLEDLDMVGGASSPTQYQLFPESQRFISMTPATPNREHSQPEVSATPILPRYAFSSECHNGSTVMALSQVFNATQNPSSPYTNGPPLSSDMPSPNIPIETRLTGTTTVFSPPLPSSVARPKHLEPQANYVSMKESQAVRDMLARLHSTDENGSSDDDFGGDDSYVQRHVREKYTEEEEEVRKHFASVTAPARYGSKGRGKRTAIDQSSPIQAESRNGCPPRTVTLKVTEIGAIERSERNHAGSSEEETEQEDEVEASQSRRIQHSQISGEDDKENVDIGAVRVPDTTTYAHDALSQALELEHSGHRNLISEVAGHTDGSQEPANRPQSTQNKSEDNTPTGSQIVNIANSQPFSNPSQKRRKGRPRKVTPRLAQSPTEECILSSPVSGLLNHPNPHALSRGSKRPGSRSRYRRVETHLDQSPEEENVHSSPVIALQEQSSLVEQQPSREGHRSSKSVSGTQHDLGDAKFMETSHKMPHQYGRHDDHAPNVESPNYQKTYLETEVKISDPNPSSEEIGAAKASSIPSRVLETPTQDKQPSKTYRQIIPETSPPSHFSKSIPTFNNNSSRSPTHDDDQLPVLPKFSRPQIGRLGVPGLHTRDGPHRTVSAVLSSPSGRQRRSMTEIAAEQSPCRSLPDFLPDFGLITAEDREFASIIRETELPAQKRRRGNDGRITGLSNLFDRNQTFIPGEPRVVPQPAVEKSEPTNKVSEPAIPVPVPPMHMDAVVIRQNPRAHVRETAGLWEVECSPVQPVEQARRGRQPRLSQPLERAVSKTRTSRQLRNSIAGPIEACKSTSLSPTSTELIDRADSPDPIQGEKTHIHSKQGCASPSLNNPGLENKVFAFFNGRPQGYFPATCVGISHPVGGTRYLVRFEDSIKPDEVNSDAVKRLELRINDIVKVDLPQVPKIPHVVVGFRKLNEVTSFHDGEATLSSTMTDVHGHHFVILRPKSSDGSFRHGLDITVPISNVYLDRILWNRLENRQYSHSPQLVSPSASELRTALNPRPSSVHSASRTDNLLPSVSGLFSGMAFAASYNDDEERRLRIEELITQNGGRILKDGFTELFNQPLSKSPSASFENNSVVTISTDHSNGLLSLHPIAEKTGFVCLLTNEHTRRVKYMQALALNIPCLSGRWVHDCVAKDQIVDWEPYLLPAGESAFLNGAIRSRAISPNPALTARLQDTIAARPKLLAGQSVLLVMDRGKIAEQRKPYSFLACALGPSRIAFVPDMNAAIKLLAPPGRESPASSAHSDVSWDWIYVGDEKAGAAARAQLIKAAQSVAVKQTSRSRSRGRPPKKAKSRSRPTEGAARAAAISAGLTYGGLGMIGGSDVTVNGKTVRILDNEFICQSLILGKLFEP